MSYVLLGACHDNDNLYVVRSVVSKLSNDVTEIDIYHLGDVKGKKRRPLIPLSSAARLLQSKALSSPRGIPPLV